MNEQALEAAAQAMCDRVNGQGDYAENIGQRRPGWLAQARAGVEAYLSASPKATATASVREKIAAIFCDEVRHFRHAQDAATTETDKLYRMGQKDAMILMAGQIDDVLAATLTDSGTAATIGGERA